MVSTHSGPASVAEVPYKECFICKPDVTTVVQTKTHGNDFFLLKTSTRHISESKKFITVAFALKYSATCLFSDGVP